MPKPKPFGATLRDLREKAGLSAADVARAVGVTRATIYNLESGASKSADWTTVQKLADLYGVSTEALRTVDKPAGAEQ